VPAGAIVVSPHRFPGLAGERELAEAHGLELVATGSQEELLAALPGARVVMMTPFALLDAGALALAPGCEAVVRYGVGYDNVDVEAATAAGIPVANVPDASTEEVALHAVAMALALLRRLPEADARIRAGEWGPSFMDGVRRGSKLTAGVVGLGRIGALVARHLAALGLRVVAYDPAVEDSPYERVGIDELVERADLVTLHVPLLPGTRDLLSAERIARMRPGAVLVNVSRGGLVDEPALAAALHEGRLGGAGLDVFATEPIPGDSPLLAAPRTLLSAHVAWRADESLGDYQRLAIEQIRLALSGEPMSCAVNPEVYRQGRTGG
jgi:D-3-phosphoglycerate dehydrogenase